MGTSEHSAKSKRRRVLSPPPENEGSWEAPEANFPADSSNWGLPPRLVPLDAESSGSSGDYACYESEASDSEDMREAFCPRDIRLQQPLVFYASDQFDVTHLFNQSSGIPEETYFMTSLLTSVAETVLENLYDELLVGCFSFPVSLSFTYLGVTSVVPSLKELFGLTPEDLCQLLQVCRVSLPTHGTISLTYPGPLGSIVPRLKKDQLFSCMIGGFEDEVRYVGEDMVRRRLVNLGFSANRRILTEHRLTTFVQKLRTSIESCQLKSN